MEKNFLSSQVRNILCKAGLSKSHDQLNSLDAKGLLDFCILELLPSDADETAEYFVEACRRLAPAFRFIHTEYESLSVPMCYLSDQLEWTSLPGVLLKSLDCLKGRDDINTMLSLLLCTSVLERSLGDVFIMGGKQCPSMLKDLLASPELIEVFGHATMKFLRLLIGPPTSLNLRNVLWHGFPCPGDIHRQYAYVMICVILSLGKLLQEKGIMARDIKHRDLITLDQTTALCAALAVDQDEDSRVWRDTFRESDFVLPSMKCVWDRAVIEYQSARYGACVTLLLPQLEHGLRCVFAEVNKCPERVLTAENATLFTTLDVILACGLDSGEKNQLMDALGVGLMNLINDVFVYPDGPRIRDRISHGETAVDGVTMETALIVLRLSVALATQYLPQSAQLYRNSYLVRLRTQVSQYESIFHPISLTKKTIQRGAFALSRWKHIPQPELSTVERTVAWQQSADYPCKADIMAAFDSLRDKYSPCIPWTLPDDLMSPFKDIIAEYETYLQSSISTLYRNSSLVQGATQSKEEEIVGLLDRIGQMVEAVANQVHDVTTVRCAQWLAKELRSRQRKTYERMLDSIPTLFSGLSLVLALLLVHLYSLDQLSCLTRDEQLKTTRLLKAALQYVERQLTYTSGDKNKWEEAVAITNELARRICQHGV